MKDIIHRKYFKYIFYVLIITLLILFLFSVIYVNDYYHADKEAISTFQNDSIVLKNSLDDNTIIYSIDKATSGFIFYPGGKVEYTAYEPLMKELAADGILCILLKMPFNLAVFDINAADGLQAKFPQIENWYIGGHSLGGAMAASYLSQTNEQFNGLVLLGSYSTSDLSQSNIDVLSIYGSQDKIINLDKYNFNKKNLPVNYLEHIIDGGCHSYFGVYGMQDGDGVPTISNSEQIMLTGDLISEFILLKSIN